MTLSVAYLLLLFFIGVMSGLVVSGFNVCLKSLKITKG